MKDMLVPEKCGSAPEMDGVSELPDGFREATITCLEFINEVGEQQEGKESTTQSGRWGGWMDTRTVRGMLACCIRSWSFSCLPSAC